MNKISEIISTPVISLYESEYVGIISNILFDYKQKKCKYACIVSDYENITKIVKFGDIYKIGYDCLFIKNKTHLELESNISNPVERGVNPINFKVYDLKGKFIGISKDIIIDDEYNIQTIELSNGQALSPESIVNIGLDIILINDKPVNISRFKPKQNISIQAHQPEQKVIALSSLKPTIEPTTTKIITNTKLLLGRIITHNITTLNGEIIVKSNSIITKDTIKKASLYGKLVELARYSTK